MPFLLEESRLTRILQRAGQLHGNPRVKRIIGTGTVAPCLISNRHGNERENDGADSRRPSREAPGAESGTGRFVVIRSQGTPPMRPGKGETTAMIKVKSFTTQLKIFHTRNELDELDMEVGDFIAARGIRKVISISDSATTGNSGETIGLIRVLAYEEPVAGSREHYQEQIESTLDEWGEEIEKIRKKADKLGADARGKYREQIEDLRARQETARNKLEDLKRTGGEAWEDLRSGAEAALDELKKGVEGAVAKLKKG